MLFNESVSYMSDISSLGWLDSSLPKLDFPIQENDARAVYQAIHDELLLDGNARQNLATFCQTWIEPEVHKLLDECINKNIVDKDGYPISVIDIG